MLLAALPFLVAATEPIERRLHTDRVESSSFLWNDWNRFQENYHPLYVADDDPKTAWVEGVEGSGKGEWLRLRITPLDGATKVRVRVRNGYQKSKSLYQANARAKTVELKLLPAGISHKIELRDIQDWQDIAVTQPAGKLEAVELRVLSVYEGKKYKDLCISDVQLFATATTPDNPAFEKSKLQRLKEWKRERAEAAKQFKDQAGTRMPLQPQYRVMPAQGWAVDAAVKKQLEACEYNSECRTRAVFQIAQAAAPEHAAAIELARKAYETSFAGWTPVQVADRDPRKLPFVEGMYAPELYMAYDYYVPENQFELPLYNTIGSLVTDTIGVFAIKNSPKPADVLTGRARSCSTGQSKIYAFAPPAAQNLDKRTSKPGSGNSNISTNERQSTRAILALECGRIEVRDGSEDVALSQILIYGDDGRLAMVAGPGYVTLYDWRPGSESPVISGGRRFFDQYNDIGQLVLREASPAAKP